MSKSTESAERVFVVTGANSGLGLETARKLAARSAHNTVILACRDLAKATPAQEAITLATGNVRIRAMRLDLSSLASVREFVAQYGAEFTQPIDVLVCNAGISRGPGQTADGLDSVFETNHLGHFLLTKLLLGRLSPTGRVISVSSDMHQPPGPKLRWPGAAALARENSRSAPSPLRYSYSKLCNLYFSYELSRRLRASNSGISAAAFNPGLMTDTNLVATPGPFSGIMKWTFASRVGDLEKSSTALAQLAAGPDEAPIDGQYFDRTASTSAPSSDLSYNVENARDLWDVSARLTGVSD
jgi:NAD(P)-dependent dehydrogenase (short-subunit alcohol dehydrogenase family)